MLHANVCYKRFNVCTKFDYVDPVDNKRKTRWYKVGTMRLYENTGAVIIRRFDNPTADYYCFEQADSTPSNETKSQAQD
jgi:hypothetical protein